MQTCDMVMSHSHGLKGGTTEQCVFCAREELLLVLAFDLFNFQDIFHAQEYTVCKTVKGRSKRKSITGLALIAGINNNKTSPAVCILRDSLSQPLDI